MHCNYCGRNDGGYGGWPVCSRRDCLDRHFASVAAGSNRAYPKALLSEVCHWLNPKNTESVMEPARKNFCVVCCKTEMPANDQVCAECEQRLAGHAVAKLLEITEKAASKDEPAFVKICPISDVEEIETAWAWMQWAKSELKIRHEHTVVGAAKIDKLTREATGHQAQLDIKDVAIKRQSESAAQACQEVCAKNAEIFRQGKLIYELQKQADLRSAELEGSRHKATYWENESSRLKKLWEQDVRNSNIEKDNLRLYISQREEAIEDMSRRLVQINELNSSLRQELDGLGQCFQEVDQHRAECCAMLDDNKLALKSQEEANQNLQALLAEKTEEAQMLEAQCDHLHQQVEHLFKNEKALNDRYASLAVEKQNLAAALHAKLAERERVLDAICNALRTLPGHAAWPVR